MVKEVDHKISITQFKYILEKDQVHLAAYSNNYITNTLVSTDSVNWVDMKERIVLYSQIVHNM